MKPDLYRPRHPAAQDAIRRWGELKADRARYEGDWEEIARFIRPQRGGFSGDDPTRRAVEKPLSSAPILAQINFASGLYGALTNPANRWFGFTLPDPDLAAWTPVAEWLDLCGRRVLASFAPSVSPFYNASMQVFSDTAAFGNAAQYDEIEPGSRRIEDHTLSLAEVVYDIDAHGHVVEVVRRFMLSARAMVGWFRPESLPPRIVEAHAKGQHERFAVYHHVRRNPDRMPGRIGVAGKPWRSLYVTEVDEALVRERGYDEMPFYAPRWEVETGAIYGFGPGYTALPSARLVHRMDEATIRAAQRAADPTILAPDRDAFPLSGRIRPGEVLHGGVSVRGEPLVRPLDLAGTTGLTIEEKREKLNEIRDAFHYTLMNLAGRTGMTATEVMTINEERMRLWAPHMGRIQEEYLAPKIARRFSMLWRARQLPPPPPEAQGMELQVDYLSAAAMAQRSTEGTAIVRVLQDLSPLAQVKPRLFDRIDDDDLVEALFEARGAPHRVLRSRETADELARQRMEAEQQAQAMQMLQQGAGAARDVAQAEAALQGGGGM